MPIYNHRSTNTFRTSNWAKCVSVKSFYAVLEQQVRSLARTEEISFNNWPIRIKVKSLVLDQLEPRVCSLGRKDETSFKNFNYWCRDVWESWTLMVTSHFSVMVVTMMMMVTWMRTGKIPLQMWKSLLQITTKWLSPGGSSQTSWMRSAEPSSSSQYRQEQVQSTIAGRLANIGLDRSFLVHYAVFMCRKTNSRQELTTGFYRRQCTRNKHRSDSLIYCSTFIYDHIILFIK